MAGGTDEGRNLLLGNRWRAAPLTAPNRRAKPLNAGAARALDDDSAVPAQAPPPVEP
jgi:hypothetical protein